MRARNLRQMTVAPRSITDRKLSLDLIFLFSTNYSSTPRGMSKQKTPSHFTSWNLMVRGVGFEPTKAFATGS